MHEKYDEYIQRIAKEHDLPDYIIEKIVDYQFKFLKKIMERKENESVYLIGLGTFKVTNRKWWYELLKRKKRLGQTQIESTLIRLSDHGLFPGLYPKEKSEKRKLLEDILKKGQALAKNSRE